MIFTILLGPVRPAPTPVRYFADHCSRCHGDSGSRYTESVAKRSRASLKEEIRAMAVGPGEAPLDPASLEAQTLYHLAILQEKPFLALTKNAKGQFAGEVDLADHLYALTAKGKIPVPIKDQAWTYTVPKSLAKDKIKFLATYGKRQTLLDPAKSPFSR